MRAPSSTSLTSGRFGLGELGNLAQMRALPVERLAGMIETCQHQAGKRQIVRALAAGQGGADIRPGFRSRPWPLFVPPQPAFSIAGAPCVAQMSRKGRAGLTVTTSKRAPFRASSGRLAR